jgi:hypothetical protein
LRATRALLAAASVAAALALAAGCGEKDEPSLAELEQSEVTTENQSKSGARPTRAPGRSR